MELVDHFVTPIGRHESILRKYPDHGKHSAVGRAVGKYFAQVLSCLLSFALSNSPGNRLKSRLTRLVGGDKRERTMKSLSQLDAWAIALEDSYVAAKEADDNKAWQKDIISSMNDMKGEIKEMRETILDLKRLIESLVVTSEKNPSPKV
ncbi:hypothetical protein N7488_012015 [Penicillium malachiteum]|nr:hypothetical protein N7488_012015 [Penicillium malachiteum]